MVIMQAGQHGPTARIEHALPVPDNKVAAQFLDPRADPDIGDRAVQQRGPLNQHDRQRLSATSRRTASLSAPSPDAGVRPRAGRGGAGAGCAEADAASAAPRRSRRPRPSTPGSIRRPRGPATRPPPGSPPARSAGRRWRRRRTPVRQTRRQAADQPTGHRGVVTERGPPGVLAVAVDPQPDSSGARCDVVRSEPASRQRRRAASLRSRRRTTASSSRSSSAWRSKSTQ